MKKGVLIISIVCLLLLSSIVAGQDISSKFFIDVETVNDNIVGDGFAVFTITITNNQELGDTFRIFQFEDVKWTAQFVPSSDNYKEVAGMEKGIVKILVKPTNVVDGNYNVRLKVKSLGTDEVRETILRMKVGTPEEALDPDFSASVVMPSQVDARNTEAITVNLKNNNALDLSGVQVTLTSDLISEEANVELLGDELKSVSFALKLPENIEPRSDFVRVVIKHGNNTVFDEFNEYEIVPYLPPYEKSVQVTNRLWRVDRVLNLKNTGNADKDDQVRLEVTKREAFFTSEEPEGELVEEDGKFYLVWEVSLPAGDEYAINLKTSYRPLIFLIILIVAILAAYYFRRSPIVVVRETKNVKYAHGGTIAEAKIFVHVRNRTRRRIKNVRVVERIPKIFSMIHETGQGYVKPKKIHMHTDEGTLLEYDLDNMDGREEFVIKYHIRSKLSVVGDAILKPTVVEYQNEKGDKFTSKGKDLIVPCKVHVSS